MKLLYSLPQSDKNTTALGRHKTLNDPKLAQNYKCKIFQINGITKRLNVEIFFNKLVPKSRNMIRNLLKTQIYTSYLYGITYRSYLLSYHSEISAALLQPHFRTLIRIAGAIC